MSEEHGKKTLKVMPFSFKKLDFKSHLYVTKAIEYPN